MSCRYTVQTLKSHPNVSLLLFIVNFLFYLMSFSEVGRLDGKYGGFLLWKTVSPIISRSKIEFHIYLTLSKLLEFIPSLTSKMQLTMGRTHAPSSWFSRQLVTCSGNAALTYLPSLISAPKLIVFFEMGLVSGSS